MMDFLARVAAPCAPLLLILISHIRANAENDMAA